MRIGEVEFTRRFIINSVTLNVSVFSDIDFAVGIKVRALLTRVQVSLMDTAAITGGGAVYFENGQNVGGAQAFATLQNDNRMNPVAVHEGALVTSGFNTVTGPIETQWWKILLPQTRWHAVHSTLGGFQAIVVLSYRFAELTDDEILEIAAQRAQD